MRFFGSPPDNLVTLGWRHAERVEAEGVRAVGYSYEAVPHRLTRAELAAVMTPPDPRLQRFSLYRMSVSVQHAVRVLLLMPVGALIVSLLRSVVGVPSYGTFMPMLLALALRGTGLGFGLALVALVLAIGILGRLAMGWLRLLLVPRLSVLLCVVVLCVITLGLVGVGMGERDYYAGILFPIVILTMLIERMSITMAEESPLQALEKALWSMLIAIAVYPVFRSELLAHVLFGFPELLFVVMGLLVWIGGYTGYRLSDLLRFRVVLKEPGAP
jgi:hypothetical protein